MIDSQNGFVNMKKTKTRIVEDERKLKDVEFRPFRVPIFWGHGKTTCPANKHKPLKINVFISVLWGTRGTECDFDRIKVCFATSCK